MITQKLPPEPGILSFDFWASAATVICTFVLNEWGISAEFIQKLPGGDSWLPILIVVAICVYLIIKSWIKARQARDGRSLPASSSIDMKTHNLLQTTEFWLGMIVVAIKLLQENGIAGTSINTSVTTAFLVLAVVYALSRSQLKLAYMKSLLFKVTRPDSDQSVKAPLVRFHVE